MFLPWEGMGVMSPTHVNFYSFLVWHVYIFEGWVHLFVDGDLCYFLTLGQLFVFSWAYFGLMSYLYSSL